MDSSGSDMEGMSNNDEDMNEEDNSRSEIHDEADVLARLKQQEREEREEIEQELKAHREALRRVERHREALLNSPHSILAGLAANPAAALLPPGSLQAFFAQTAPLALPHLAPVTPTSQTSGESQWNFDEQFKQREQAYVHHSSITELYELSSDPQRKEFLDELFSFMQKRGTPINRLPIMAKQVLDLYELYNLVIARGGLVEVINKKLWQEIIKGLKLPSSITSAAFTLRTQYMKYLYPYECEKKKLSTPADLQAAIDTNRREGRRNGYANYPDMPSRNSFSGSPISSQLAPPSLLAGYPTTNGLYNTHPEHAISPLRPPSPQREALNLTDSSRDKKASLNGANKRHLDEDPRFSNSTLSSTNIKVASRGIDGRSDGSLVVSMEVNGVMYQGVLFAQSHFLTSPGTRIS